jgi:predicted glycosyltransferase
MGMKIFIYCQHVWGLGHLCRILEIARALASHDVLLVTGGPSAAVPFPAKVRRVQLPALRMRADKQLVADDGRALEAVWAERITMLHDLFRAETPEAFIIELYPFGRTAFGRELDPLLTSLRSGGRPACRVYCSVRDILVAKRDPPAYEARVARKLNRWFDALLVHADPAVVRLDATFDTMTAIQIPVVYTGYVAPPFIPHANRRQALRRELGLPADAQLIVVSAGGGRAGYPLLAAVLAAQPLVAVRWRVRMLMFTGPYMPEAERDALRAAAGNGIVIRRFTDDFRSWLAAADLSISMAGYNTCMNLIAAGRPALVWPFAGDREQPLRAARLAARGWLTVLAKADLEPSRLAARIATALNSASRPCRPIDLQGAAQTARLVVQDQALAPSDREPQP